MNVLGIETSCDETAAAVVSTTGNPARPWQTRANVIASQVNLHREWGGVVPEIASRQHVRDICGVVERALMDAGAGWNGEFAIKQHTRSELAVPVFGDKEATVTFTGTETDTGAEVQATSAAGSYRVTMRRIGDA